ncbi:photosystem I assembly factor PSA3, chloroplastic [Nymphaea colorata]|nr:photosystem I assembly factor PSA3, chloroplastic [Nymphaea colorata]
MFMASQILVSAQPSTPSSSAILQTSIIQRNLKVSLFSPPNFLIPRLLVVPKGKPTSVSGRNGKIVAYMETSNSFGNFFRKVVGALPVVGLVARIVSDEGGIGDDLIDFAEFRRRVGKKCGVEDSKAFYEFKDRRGREGEPLYVLLCCWLAAVGAGLLKSEDILTGVARLRISNDLEFEEQTFVAMMNDAKARRAKLKAANPEIPMEIRAEKALEAIHVCCFGKDPIEEEDEKLLCVMLNAVFPSVGQSKINEIVSSKAKEIAGGSQSAETINQQNSAKEAGKLQLKEFELLKRSSDSFN